jgi:putative glutamine amidotransferase
MARPVVGIISNSHLINNEYPAHAGGTMNSCAVAHVSGCVPLLIPSDPSRSFWRCATASC